MNIFSILREKKDHIINKLDIDYDLRVNLINLFKRRPDLENKVDWNNKAALDEAFWTKFIKEVDNQVTNSKVKTLGLKAFVDGKDYLEITLSPSFQAIIPLNHKCSKYLGSHRYFDVEAKWCIAQNARGHWDDYIKHSDFIICVDVVSGTKIALQIEKTKITLWDKNDYSMKINLDGSLDKEDREMNNVLDSAYYFFLNKIQPVFKELMDEFDKAITDQPSETSLRPTVEGENNEIARFSLANPQFVKRRKNKLLPSLNKTNSINSMCRQDFEDVYVAGDGYFYIQKVIIEEGVKKLGEQCFFNWKHLTEIELPNSLKEIGNKAFSHTRIREVQLPKITKLGIGAFGACQSLKRVFFHPETKLTTLEAGIFNLTKIEEIKLPDSIQIIDSNCFSECYELRTIDLPKSLTTIKEGAFDQCYALKEFDLNKCPNFERFEKSFRMTSLKKLNFDETKYKLELPDLGMRHCLDTMSISDMIIKNNFVNDIPSYFNEEGEKTLYIKRTPQNLQDEQFKDILARFVEVMEEEGLKVEFLN